MKINDSVSFVLERSTIDENKLFLPNYQLERNLYLAVNKVLGALGGKWNRSAKAHIFDKNPSDIIEEILLTGEYTDAKKEFQFFETPDNLARQLVEMAEIRKGETVLEPSAGRGRIAKYLSNCDCVELNYDNRKYLKEQGFNVVADDFLSFSRSYDVIVANPPFSKQQDIDHVRHMIELANRRVVSIMSDSVTFRDNNKAKDFRKLIEKLDGTFESLPEKSFAGSGTNVRACIVTIDLNGHMEDIENLDIKEYSIIKNSVRNNGHLSLL